MRFNGFLYAACAFVAVGCASAKPTTSTVSGSIAQASFASPVQQIHVVGSDGTTSAVAVDATGAFEITLNEGASYRFFLSADGKSQPIVVNTDLGRLVTEVDVASGGASVDIGQVRFWSGTAESARSVRVVPGSAFLSQTVATCANGVFQGTTEPCASGTAAIACTDEGSDGHKGMSGHMSAPSVTDPTTDAVAGEPVGIPEHYIASSLSCGCVGGDHHGGG